MAIGANDERKKEWRLIHWLVLVIIIFAVGAPLESWLSKPDKKADAMPMPADEQEFVAVVTAAQSHAANAENDMQRGGILAARNTELCGLFHGNFTVANWTGLADTIDSNSDGKGVLGIKLADRVTVTTWNNSFSDLFADTLMEPGTPLFEAASQLKQGQPVTFSGTFHSDSDTCVREASLTLDGKLRDPEFIFTFSGVSGH